MSSSEAAVLLATEPLWAAVFASFLLHETMGVEDIVGGALIIAACLTNTVKPETLQDLLGIDAENELKMENDDILPLNEEAVETNSNERTESLQTSLDTMSEK